MQADQNGVQFTAAFEGCRLTAYVDIAGVVTIGYGTIVYPDGTPVKLGDTLSQSEANSCLLYQMNLKAKQITPMVIPKLNQNQQNALIDFAYNVGTGAFQGSTLRRLINANPADPNITSSFEVWDKAHVNGQLIPVEGLLERRQKEAQLFFT